MRQCTDACTRLCSVQAHQLVECIIIHEFVSGAHFPQSNSSEHEPKLYARSTFNQTGNILHLVSQDFSQGTAVLPFGFLHSFIVPLSTTQPKVQAICHSSCWLAVPGFHTLLVFGSTLGSAGSGLSQIGLQRDASHVVCAPSGCETNKSAIWLAKLG